MKFTQHIGTSHKWPVNIQWYFRGDGGTLQHVSYVAVYDAISHSSSTVLSIVQKLFDKEIELPGCNEIQYVHYWTDSPTSQYRNRYIFDAIVNNETLVILLLGTITKVAMARMFVMVSEVRSNDWRMMLFVQVKVIFKTRLTLWIGVWAWKGGNSFRCGHILKLVRFKLHFSNVLCCFKVSNMYFYHANVLILMTCHLKHTLLIYYLVVMSFIVLYFT